MPTSTGGVVYEEEMWTVGLSILLTVLVIFLIVLLDPEQ